MACFVLVHGAWEAGWVWKETASNLRDAGHDVFTPSLTGLGERAHLIGPDVEDWPMSGLVYVTNAA